MTYAGLLLVLVPLLGARGISGGSRGCPLGRRRDRARGRPRARAHAHARRLPGPRRRRSRRPPGRAASLAFAAPFASPLFFVLMPLAVRDRLMSVDEPARRHDERPARDVEGGPRDDRGPAAFRRRAGARQGALSRLPRARLGGPDPGPPPQQPRHDRRRDGDPFRPRVPRVRRSVLPRRASGSCAARRAATRHAGSRSAPSARWRLSSRRGCSSTTSGTSRSSWRRSSSRRCRSPPPGRAGPPTRIGRCRAASPAAGYVASPRDRRAASPRRRCPSGTTGPGRDGDVGVGGHRADQRNSPGGPSERVGPRRGLGLPGPGGLGALFFFLEG